MDALCAADLGQHSVSEGKITFYWFALFTFMPIIAMGIAEILIYINNKRKEY
jgi:sulfite exporter TauE/SafE